MNVSDVRSEPLVACTGMGEDWTGFWRLEPRDGGDPATLGPTLADTYDDKLEAIAEDTAIAVVPADDRRFTLRPDLIAVPIDGAEPSQVVVAGRAGETNPLVAEFVRSAQKLLVRDAARA